MPLPLNLFNTDVKAVQGDYNTYNVSLTSDTDEAKIASISESKIYTQTNFLPLSGGTVTGQLTLRGAVSGSGNPSVCFHEGRSIGFRGFSVGTGIAAGNSSFAFGKDCYSGDFSFVGGYECTAGAFAQPVGATVGKVGVDIWRAIFSVGTPITQGVGAYIIMNAYTPIGQPTRSLLSILNGVGTSTIDMLFLQALEGNANSYSSLNNVEIYFSNLQFSSNNGSVALGYQSKSSGDGSISVGYRSTARGNRSVALGSNTSAIGQQAIAMGNFTSASGLNAFAAGYNSYAAGDQAFTVGNTTQARGNNSVAFGASTLASGDYSHAEGSSNIASGQASHAEGVVTTASGIASHAEGGTTTASGQSSHAEGAATTASGIASHAEGDTNTASGIASHAEGVVTTASGDYSHTEGFGTSTGDNVEYVSYDDATKTFTFSPASLVISKFGGYNTGSIITGYDNGLLGDYFRATVQSKNAGAGTITITEDVIGGSSANGYLINNSGIYSHAEGNSSIASNQGSHAEGGYTTASGNYSHAEGGDTTASGDYSHAEGYRTRARGNSSHAAGQFSEAAHNKTWVWHGSTTTNYVSSTRTNQFVVSAAGGIYFPGNVGIGTDNNSNALTVNGILSSYNAIRFPFTSTAPSNTTTPSSWLDIYVNDTLYKLPLYQ